MRILVSGLILSFAAALSACGGGGAVANGNTANNPQANNQQVAPANSFYAIQNNSNYDIYYVYMSSSRDPNWGPDQLGNDVLRAHTTYRFNGVPCDTYDLKLVDEDGDECVQSGVQVCQNTTLVINQADLLRCEGY